jgi:hypothetical protein
MIAARAPISEAENEVMERMVSAMVEIMDEQEDCLPHELVEKGFTVEQVNRLWAKAKAIAVFELRVSKR